MTVGCTVQIFTSQVSKFRLLRDCFHESLICNIPSLTPPLFIEVPVPSHESEW